MAAHLLITVDGTWNGTGVTTTVGTVDGTNGAGMITIDECPGTVTICVLGNVDGI
jgi:hypothetical protein